MTQNPAVILVQTVFPCRRLSVRFVSTAATDIAAKIAFHRLQNSRFWRWSTTAPMLRPDPSSAAACLRLRLARGSMALHKAQQVYFVAHSTRQGTIIIYMA